MRKQIAAANWKMNLSVSEAATLFDQLLVTEHNLSAHQETIFAVPAIYIPLATQKLTGKNNYYVAAQNCYPKSNGAYTSLTDRFGMQIYHDFNELYTYIEDNLIDLYRGALGI